MELSNKIKLSNIILENSNERYCEIYQIKNLVNNKIYIGQAVSHILNHKKYRPYGREGRFKCHISEAFSKKKNQSFYLNNAIKKYGISNFKVELLEYCELTQSDERETYYIKTYNSLYPEGYNLKNGGSTFKHTPKSKKILSIGVENYYRDKKFDRFKNINIDLNEPYEKYIKPLNRHGKQYGWYVYICKKKADFGGVHISIEDSYNNAIHFIELLKTIRQNTLMRETP